MPRDVWLQDPKLYIIFFFKAIRIHSRKPLVQKFLDVQSAHTPSYGLLEKTTQGRFPITIISQTLPREAVISIPTYMSRDSAGHAADVCSVKRATAFRERKSNCTLRGCRKGHQEKEKCRRIFNSGEGHHLKPHTFKTWKIQAKAHSLITDKLSSSIALSFKLEFY